MTRCEMACILRELLESSFPHTVKVPGRHGGYLRVPVSQNAEWYRRFCARHTRLRGRKHRTIIKRCHTIRALRRIERGDFRGVYAERLSPFLTEEWVPRKVPVEMMTCEEAVF